MINELIQDLYPAIFSQIYGEDQSFGYIILVMMRLKRHHGLYIKTTRTENCVNYIMNSSAKLYIQKIYSVDNIRVHIESKKRAWHTITRHDKDIDAFVSYIAMKIWHKIHRNQTYSSAVYKRLFPIHKTDSIRVDFQVFPELLDEYHYEINYKEQIFLSVEQFLKHYPNMSRIRALQHKFLNPKLRDVLLRTSKSPIIINNKMDIHLMMLRHHLSSS